MKKQKKQSLNKKPIVAIIVGGFVLAAFGFVFAFRGSIAHFINGIKAGEYSTSYSENFTSPDNWAPCTTTPKTVVATNNNSEPIIVRVMYDEYWKNKDNASLPLEQDGNRVTTINFDNVEDWTLNEEDGWYYYKEPVQPGQSTSSFMASVTFNCSFNLGSNTLNVCDSQGNCSTPANQYGNAKYHVEVTIQTTLNGGTWPAIDPCKSKILFNEIACHTQGPDTNISFRNGGGSGVYTRAPYVDDSYPVYYYRGDIDNNYVVWANYCWQVLRTTSTGGVKLIYDDPVQNDNGVQTCNPSYGRNGRALISDYGSDDMPYNYSNYGFGTNTPAQVYYMYGGPYYIVDYYNLGGQMPKRTGSVQRFGSAWDVNSPYWEYSQMGTALEHDGAHYAPAGDILRTHFYTGWFTGFDQSLITEEMRASHRYFCDDSENGLEKEECRRGAVLITGNQIFRLYGGELTIQDALNNLQQNTYSSDAKTVIDKWYAENLTSYTSQLEDTVFCADRRMSGYLTNPYYVTDGGSMITTFGTNNTAALSDPRVECPRLIDSYTVNQSPQGNGALTYPIGLPTAQEAIMAGSLHNVIRYKSWISNTRRAAWTMTPKSLSGAGDWGNVFLITDYNTDSTADERACSDSEIRPVVSLKPGTKFSSGNGKPGTPYIIE